MNSIVLSPKKSSINASIENVASDKSISHRSIIFAFLSDKESIIKNFLPGEDTLNTLKIAMQLGMHLKVNDKPININEINKIKANDTLKISAKSGILEPDDVLDCGNAGTAIRLYMGLLSGVKGYFVLNGDKYLRIRPMARVIEPLNKIGANISARKNNSLAPISIIGSNIKGFDYHSNISSAQVKSAMILAGLNANSISKFSEISKSRDHSERILNGMGAKLEISENIITIHPLKNPLAPLDIEIPADPSSAFYFAVLALITKNSTINIKNMLLNKTRIEAFRVLEKMGAEITIKKTSSKYEDIGDISISKSGELKGVVVDRNISWLIDEIPALAIAFAFANGKSEIKNASELRIKESDRIKAIILNLVKFNIKCEEKEDGFIIYGGFKPTNKTIEIQSYGDHRIAMSFALLGAVCKVKVLDSACINVSFPNFLEIIKDFIEVEAINAD